MTWRSERRIESVNSNFGGSELTSGEKSLRCTIGRSMLVSTWLRIFMSFTSPSDASCGKM